MMIDGCRGMSGRLSNLEGTQGVSRDSEGRRRKRLRRRLGQRYGWLEGAGDVAEDIGWREGAGDVVEDLGWREGAGNDAEDFGWREGAGDEPRTTVGRWWPLAGRCGWGYDGTPGRIIRTPQYKLGALLSLSCDAKKNKMLTITLGNRAG